MHGGMRAVAVWAVLGCASACDGGAAPTVALSSDAEADAGADSAAGDAGELPVTTAGLLWPIDCVPEQTCERLRYPDDDDDGIAHDCGELPAAASNGTDVFITEQQMDEGVAVVAAADGEVLWVADGKYDRCPNADEPDCQRPDEPPAPGGSAGATACTERGPYCRDPDARGSCYWCFTGGNHVALRHEGIEGVFITRYAHLKRDSVLVAPGDRVRAGETIALVGSSGRSSGPHLMFVVWGKTFGDPVDPWAGPCGTRTDGSLWAHDPPWSD